MAKAAKQNSRAARHRSATRHARTAKAVAAAIATARKAAGKGGDDADIHVHVGDVVMMGFDEAVDAEEWGARETTTEAGGAGRRSGRANDPQDEKNRRVHRTITLRKGALKLRAVEKSHPVRRKKAAKKKAARVAKKPDTKPRGKVSKKRAGR